MAKQDVEEEQQVIEEQENINPDRNLTLEEAAMQAFDKVPTEEEKPEVKEEVQVEEPKEEKETEEEPKEEEEGYYADELEEDEPSEEVPESVKEEWKNLTPLQRYLADNIDPLTITGNIDGKPTSLKIYAVENIPRNFEFDSKADERLALVNLDRMERKAEKLEEEFNLKQQQEAANHFSEQENIDIRRDIADLQREGELPLFTKGMNVDEDPKAEIAREVLDFYNKENQKRLEVSNSQGRLFHRLSYKDAYYLWKATNKPVDPKLQAEDKERQEITSRQAKSQRQGAPSRESRKLGLPRNANWDQIINAVLGE